MSCEAEALFAFFFASRSATEFLSRTTSPCRAHSLARAGMESNDAPDDEIAAAYEPSPVGKCAKSTVAALHVDMRKVHEEYLDSVRASVTTYVKRVEAMPSVFPDAGRGPSDLDARIAASKAYIIAGRETELEAKRRHEEKVRSVKRVDEILESLDALAAAAGDDPVRRDDAAAKLEALAEYKLLDDLRARSAGVEPTTEGFEAKERREETAEAGR